MKGTIKNFDYMSGSGIILTESGKELYFTYTDLVNFNQSIYLINGLKVNFNEENEKVKDISYE